MGKSSIPGREYLAYAEAQGFEKAQHGEKLQVYKFSMVMCRGFGRIVVE